MFGMKEVANARGEKCVENKVYLKLLYCEVWQIYGCRLRSFGACNVRARTSLSLS
jgi:hypothetical protein